jgi:hypothetical protein
LSAGLAAGSKYTLALAIVPVLLASLLYLSRERRLVGCLLALVVIRSPRGPCTIGLALGSATISTARNPGVRLRSPAHQRASRVSPALAHAVINGAGRGVTRKRGRRLLQTGYGWTVPLSVVSLSRGQWSAGHAPVGDEYANRST